MMRICKPVQTLASMVAIPCDECGAKEVTVGFKAYRLCEGCLAEALGMLTRRLVQA